MFVENQPVFLLISEAEFNFEKCIAFRSCTEITSRTDCILQQNCNIFRKAHLLVSEKGVWGLDSLKEVSGAELAKIRVTLFFCLIHFPKTNLHAGNCIKTRAH